MRAMLRRTGLVAFVLAFLLVASASTHLEAACSQCWNLATGLNGGFSADLFDRIVITRKGPVHTIFAAVQGGTAPGLYQSTNLGVSYTLVKAFTQPNKIAILQTNAGSNGRLFVAANEGLYYTDTFKKWVKVGGGLPQNNFITFVSVTVADSGLQMYANVDHTKVVTGGLWRSLDSGVSWTRVVPFADVRSLDTSLGCAPTQNKVFAAVHASAGAPSGAILVSSDNGATWSGVDQTFSNANSIVVDCGVGGTSRFIYVTAEDNIGATWINTDFSLFFGFDDNGIAANSATSLFQGDGLTVATLGAGLYNRICSADGSCNPMWTQIPTTGLTDLNVRSAITTFQDPTTLRYRYLASTLSGTFYFQP